MSTAPLITSFDIDAACLPDDPAMLKPLVLEILGALKEATTKNAQLEHHLDVLRRRIFGPRSERECADQMKLPFAAPPGVPADGASTPAPEPVTPTAPAATAEPKQPKQRPAHGRRPIPAHLPRRRVVYDVAPEGRICPCCGLELRCIGEDTSEQVEFIPETLVVLVHARKKYAPCDNACPGTAFTVAKPPQPVEKGLPGPGLLSQVIVSKYGDHLPLYRQEGIFVRSGWEIPRSTQCGWLAASADLLAPIARAMAVDVLRGAKLHADDTVCPVLEPGRGSTRTARQSVYIGDDAHPHNVFQYTPDHTRKPPRDFLAPFRGLLHCDAHDEYKPLFAGEGVLHVACWAHARRYFVDARMTGGTEVLQALAFIRRLYDVERLAAGKGDAERRSIRQEHAVVVLDEFKHWLDAKLQVVLPKSPLGQAIGYAIKYWEALRRYADHGIADIDNNAAERALRRVVLGRKNWLFAGSDEGGRRAAIFFTLIDTCRRHDIEPFAYLRDAIQYMGTDPHPNPEAMMPHRWKQRVDRALQAAEFPPPSR